MSRGAEIRRQLADHVQPNRVKVWRDMATWRWIDLPRRMRAAREMGGFRSVEALTVAIGQSGLGLTKLREIEQGKKTPEERDVRTIAATCGVPFEWFTVDINDAIAKGDEPSTLEELQALLRRLAAGSDQKLGAATEALQAIAERVDAIYDLNSRVLNELAERQETIIRLLGRRDGGGDGDGEPVQPQEFPASPMPPRPDEDSGSSGEATG